MKIELEIIIDGKNEFKKIQLIGESDIEKIKRREMKRRKFKNIKSKRRFAIFW